MSLTIATVLCVAPLGRLDIALADRAASAQETADHEDAASDAEEEMLARAQAEARLSGDSIKEAAIRAEVERRVQEAQREAELDRLTDKMRNAREVRAARSETDAGTAASPKLAAPAQPRPLPLEPTPRRQIAASPSPPTDLPAAPPFGPPTVGLMASTSGSATILLIMKPGDAGIRRFEKTADPILCLGQTCYISQGPDRDAKAMPRHRALGPGNTLGGRAGACVNTLTCVFRNVDLSGGPGFVQPIDMRLLRHDRREPRPVLADQSCTMLMGRLACQGEVRGPDYRLWAVPEAVAAAVDPQHLQAALASGLPVTTAGRY